MGVVYCTTDLSLCLSLPPSLVSSYGSVGDVLLSEVDCYGNGDYLHILRCSYKTGIHNCQDKYTTLYCSE